jgi:putative hydrolase of the HAD superfamily
MAIKAVIFDIYGTLIDIETDERDWYTYLNLAKYLGYRGLDLSADEVKWFYFEKIRNMIENSKETYPEINVRQIWYDILREHENPQHYRLKLDKGTFVRDIVVLHRALTRKKFRLYNESYNILKTLKNKYRIGIVSDCQYDYAIPETKMLGILPFFDVFIISGDYGFRKPDKRLFKECLSKLKVSPHETVFIGDNAFRDISGAKSVGMKTILVMSRRESKDPNLPKPDFRVWNIGEVLRIIENIR